jgi:antitoxin (DNA-binding transcriptional repressor) of toxin-antitoxin stability system
VRSGAFAFTTEFIQNLQDAMPHVDLKEAEGNLRVLIEKAARGEEIVITDKKKPVARLSVIRGQKPQFGSAKDEIWMSDDFDDPLDEFADSCLRPLDLSSIYKQSTTNHYPDVNTRSSRWMT